MRNLDWRKERRWDLAHGASLVLEPGMSDDEERALAQSARVLRSAMAGLRGEAHAQQAS